MKNLAIKRRKWLRSDSGMQRKVDECVVMIVARKQRGEEEEEKRYKSFILSGKG